MKTLSVGETNSTPALLIRSFRFRVATVPANCTQIDFARGAKPDSLLLEPKPLLLDGAGVSQADRAGGIDDAMPGQPVSGSQSSKGVADLTRPIGNAREPGDLAVGRYPPPRNPCNDRIDPIV